MNRETKVRVVVKLVAEGIIVALTTVELRQASCVMGSATRRPAIQAVMRLVTIPPNRARSTIWARSPLRLGAMGPRAPS